MSLRSDPWIAFYPSDFLAGTRGMTPSEIGVYIVLLSMMFERDGYIDLEEKRLARLCNCTPATFRKILAALMADGKIEREPRGLSNKRAIFEVKRRETLSDNGAKAAAARWEKEKQKQGPEDASALPAESAGSARGYANHSHNHNHIKTAADDSRAEGASQPNLEAAKPPPQPESHDQNPLAPTHRERLLEAMGIGPDGRTATGRFLGRTTDMALVSGWSGMGLSEAEQIGVVTEVMTRRMAAGDGSPPASFKYFDPAMQELARTKAGQASGSGGRKRGETFDIAAMVKRAAEKVRDAN
jgi:uncharacterized protein YdaU (DUF1376 family)